MTTYLQTLMHLVKGIIGAGVFSMGVAFKNGGVIFALILTPLVGLLVLHCVTLLIRVIEIKESQTSQSKNQNENGSKTYADTVEEIFLDGPPRVKALAKYMKIIVNVEICLMNLGFCCIYVVFIGNNMQKALQYFDVHFSIYIVMLIFITPMWLSSLITNLKWLAPVSTFANAILFTAIVITLYYICVDVQEFSSLKYIAGIDTIPLFLAVALYSYDSVALVVPLRNEIDRPGKMVGLLGVLNIGFLIVIPIITALGFFSYFKYGEKIRGTIFLNLPEDDKLVQALLLLVCIQVLFSYPVQLYVPVTILWPMIVERYGPFKHNLRMLLCFRTSLVLLTLAISEAIPFIDLIISLIGAICSSCLTLFIPPILEIVVTSNRDETNAKRTYILVKDSLIALLAVVIFFTGIFTSVRDIINSF
ncbi:hypothetical protein Trydic_g15047 [Trypoxylus dichotomus]